jgi:hypothetical protein
VTVCRVSVPPDCESPGPKFRERSGSLIERLVAGRGVYREDTAVRADRV